MGGLLAATAAPASAAVTCASPGWKAQFYANTTFGGSPKLTACDSAISENYGTGDPAGVTLPKDNFSVRWSVTRDFGSGGPFTLAAQAQDGIRVYLDNVRKIDLWKNVSATRKSTVNVTIPSGKHTLRVDFVAWTGAADVKFTYSPATSATVDKVKPLAPTGLTARIDSTTAKAVFSWSRNQEMDLAGYRLYRRPKDGSNFQYVASATGTATTASDLPPFPGLTYVYEVRAYDKAGNTSAGSADQQVTAPVLAAPSGLTAKGLDEGVKLTWNAVPGAMKYNVTRKRSGKPPLSMDTTGTTFTDTTAPRSREKSTYDVSAVDGAGRYSEAAVVTAVRPVAAPHDVTATPLDDHAVLTWKIDRATDGNYYDFHVYRSRSLPVDTSTEPVRCETDWEHYDDGRLGCTDRTTAAKTTYHYVIKGFDNAERESAASAPATVTTLGSPRDLTPPAAVTGLTLKATEYGIVLDWNAGTEPDLGRYVVYRGTVHESEDEDEPDVCSGRDWAYLDPATTHYVDATLPNGGQHCYWIDAVDTSGNSSFWWTGTAEATAVTELDLTPSVATPGDSPVDLTATAREGHVDLSWNRVAGATGYRVYRWDRAEGRYVSLTGDALIDGTSYQDTTATTGTTHFYWVTAVLADGTESAPGADWAILLPSDD